MATSNENVPSPISSDAVQHRSTATKTAASASSTQLIGASPQHSTPDHNWSPEQLTRYVKKHLANREDMTEQLVAVGRRSTVELFRAGRALHFLRDKLKADNAYVKWLEDNDIARTTAHDAIKLYCKAKSESAVEKLTITEAKVTFGISKARKKSKPIAPKPSKEGDDASQEDGPPDFTKADTVLVVMAKKLEEVVNWDRTDLDPVRLDGLARRCIDLLRAFLQKAEVPGQKSESKKPKVTHAK
jgi:hypothetical protein